MREKNHEGRRETRRAEEIEKQRKGKMASEQSKDR